MTEKPRRAVPTREYIDYPAIGPDISERRTREAAARGSERLRIAILQALVGSVA